MKALSLTQPWAWIVLRLDKRIENRTRNIGNHRGPVLLHAALRCTEKDWYGAFGFVRDRVGSAEASRIPHPKDLVRGAIVGRCNIVDQWGKQLPLPFGGDWTEQRKRWYMGAHAWLLADVQETKIIPCKGALGFWNVSNDVLVQLDPWLAFEQPALVHWSAFDDAVPCCGAPKPTWDERDQVSITPNIKHATCPSCQAFHAAHILPTNDCRTQ